MAAGIEAAARPGGPGVRVWDPVVRAFHWMTVVGCVLDLGLLEEGEGPHRLVGYVLAAVLAIRILWDLWARVMRASPTSSPRRAG